MARWFRSSLEQLIANLDDKELEKRQRATEELENLGDAAEEALTKLLASKPALEARQRAESILKKLEATLAERLRPLRALEALEHIGTSEAKQVLAKLAKGEPAAPLTREAGIPRAAGQAIFPPLTAGAASIRVSYQTRVAEAAEPLPGCRRHQK